MKSLEKYIDHTLLKPGAGIADIQKLCREAKEHGFYAREGGDRDPWFLHVPLPGGPASARSARNPAAPGDYYFSS